MNSLKYLIYDIETIINKSLLNRVCYAGEGLTDEGAHQKQLAELALDNRDFINPAFHRPICLAVVSVAEDFSISKIGLLGNEKKDYREIVTHFWEIYNKHKPTLVDFNGKGFDLRVLELWAFELGLAIHPRHFDKFGTRYKFAEEHHLDLQDFLTNFGAIRLKGGLNLFAKLLGKPGKMDTKGAMVQELYEKGEIFRIENYCLGDVMDTYFVFLRTRVMTGQITLDEEKFLVEQALRKMEEKAKEEGYLKEYLELCEKN